MGRSNGIPLPLSAIVADPQRDKTVVFVQTHDAKDNVRFTQRDVIVVNSDDKLAEVAGVRAGEHVAAQGAFALLAPAGGE